MQTLLAEQAASFPSELQGVEGLAQAQHAEGRRFADRVAQLERDLAERDTTIARRVVTVNELQAQLEAAQTVLLLEQDARAAAEARVEEFTTAAPPVAGPLGFSIPGMAGMSLGPGPADANLSAFALQQGVIHTPERLPGDKQDWEAWAQGYRDFWAIARSC